MASNYYSDYSKLDNKPCMYWTIREGTVQVISESHGHPPIVRYLQAKCGVIDDWPARLECYKDIKSANEEESLLWRIYFTDVERVYYTERRQRRIVITIHMQKCNKIIFTTDSNTSTMEWYKFCSLLFKIPKYAIPKVPKENFMLQKGISDKGNNWMVNILREGIGCIAGLCDVSMCDANSTFNISDHYNGKRLLSWHRDDIGLSGCIDSLIFVEITKTQCGEPGLLWMQHPIPQSTILHKNIHDFLYAYPKECKTPSPVSYVFVDSAMSHAHIKDDMDQELSQTPYEDQLSVSLSSVVTCSPVSQSASLSSESSQCSSGYYSDSSCGGSISLKRSQLSHTKVMPDKYVESLSSSNSLKKPSAASLPVEATSPTTSNNTHVHSSLLITTGQRKLSNTHKVSSSVQHHSTIPQHPRAKNTRIPQPSLRSNQYASNSCHFSSSIKDSISSSSSTKSISKQQLEEKILLKCSVIIHDNLDIFAILPQLMAQEMLTKKDHQTLINLATTDVDKVHYLLSILPRKGEGFLHKFMHCLCETKDTTGHGDIVKALKAKLKKAGFTE